MNKSFPTCSYILVAAVNEHYNRRAFSSSVAQDEVIGATISICAGPSGYDHE